MSRGRNKTKFYRLKVKSIFEPKIIEKKWYDFWESNDLFAPDEDSTKEPFCIMIPPPNVTGSLHMGHGFQNTLMDTLARYKRLKGFEVLWQVGTDHAGIATQIVVERNLEKKGITKESLGRENFEKEIWKWKEESGSIITKQLRRLGASLDWKSEKFTMDDDFSDAVTEVFCSLYDEGLIYQGYRLVNWDYSLQTALSDLEVISSEESGKLWEISYPTEIGDLTVATTRPETMLGDVALAVNPNDKRYKKYIGKEATIPLTTRKIPIIGDDYVDMEFGTGCLKITPGHDFNDFEIGKRNNLPVINILNKDGSLNEGVPKRYQGMSVVSARKEILKDLENLGNLINEKDHKTNIPKSERTGTTLEPFLTKQWYLKSEEMAKKAKEIVKTKKVTLIPQNWENTYFSWMNEIRDWCISRQLWWGHRIPAWYDADKNVYVGKSEAEARKKNNLDESISLTQDEDVLDTWFSSQLWTFVTLGWPKKTKRLKKFHPTSVLITGFDIIFFWVARMIMITQKFLEEVPFKEVYIHGLVRDGEGQKMSKSKGNILDPIDIIDGIELDRLIEKRTSGLMNPKQEQKIIKNTKKEFPDGIKSYGTDAMRFTFCSLASGSRDINFDIKRVEGYRNFSNKIWNASRFIMLQCEDFKNDKNLSNDEIDLWIQSEFNKTSIKFSEHIENYRFDLATQELYEFIWDKFCDWYLELCKIRLQDDSNSKKEKDSIKSSLIDLLTKILIVSHPIMPFITEEIWQNFQKFHGSKSKSISLEKFPDLDQKIQEFKQVVTLQSAITGIRNLRAEMKIPPKVKIRILIDKGSALNNLIEKNRIFFDVLAGIEEIGFFQNSPPPSAIVLADKEKLYIPLEGLIDPKDEIERNTKNLVKFNKVLLGLDLQLKNKNFIKNAPDELIIERKAQLKEMNEKIKKLKDHLKILEQL